MTMLEIRNLSAGYQGTAVLFGLSLTVKPGQFVTLLGRNGMGKSTTVRAIFRLVSPTSGTITFDGDDLAGVAPFRIARRGIGLVPEGRCVCDKLTVEENLRATGRACSRDTDWSVEGVYELFPQLARRKTNLGSQLSGGEQQLLAIGRALMMNPKLLILDEATEGLSPLMRQEVWRCLAVLRERGQSILIIDKHVKKLAEIGDRHYVIEKGRILWEGDRAAFSRERHSLESSLGVA
jgi:branched-chain amino acid transport system ATP-binding protein